MKYPLIHPIDQYSNFFELWLQDHLQSFFPIHPSFHQMEFNELPADESACSSDQPTLLSESVSSAYLKGEFRNVLPILRQLALKCRNCLRLPLLKSLVAVAKLFQLTHIEALFLVYLLRETNWAVRDPLVVKHSPGVRDLMFTHVSQQPEFKNLILYLTLACFSLKESLSDQGDEFWPVAVRVCPTFQEVYEEWAQQYAGHTNNICPKDINKLYSIYAAHINDRTSDYTSMVDQIIDISPAYSFSRSLMPKIAHRIVQNTLEEPAPRAPSRKESSCKLEIQFEAKFCATFYKSELSKLEVMVSTDDVDLFEGREDDSFLMPPYYKTYENPIDEDEECEEENLPPLSEERMVLMHAYNSPQRDLDMGNFEGCRFGELDQPSYFDDFF